MTRVPGGPGARGPLGDLEDTAIVRQTSLLLETVDIIAADAGSWGAVSSRLSMQQQRQSQQQGPSPGRWGLLPRLCALEDFKDLERRQMTKQLRADHSQSQKEQQKQGQAVFPGAETACVFISAFIEEATPYLISFVRLLPSLRRLTICSFFSEEQHRWHACCMQQQAGMSVQRLAATLRRQREGLQPTLDGPSGAPKWQGPLEVEVLHTPFHATFLTQRCFLLTGGQSRRIDQDEQTKTDSEELTESINGEAKVNEENIDKI
ncbi:hypothetical protein, conserved [Eimeria necatrix]|uniref:Uncharacterized protein n=1 Tax=Eimeria necatrix TaxID=51315 RepID=U6MNR4_9EIME|nr:hypothetical protein, conserved [Eimeria necatrix]CDJ64089.1 hypothetical protein, conserved [Eimeria necatrix]